ncbi:DNA-processing protein DprA [Methylophaga sp.]|jgi:DNA processing protein|uniref:DNA-processing protein DprA n=1 Tax=Methylophaga sp. TaxID=2024840 RepID=UPI0013FF3208|nr:DNA-processing protein DprA [Methylophaga sp.]MTI62947.1 DNA-protecting protein DprA [Methylophaga sp.]
MSTNKQDALACWIALQRVPGLGPVTFTRLLEQYGSPAEILRQPKQLTGVSEKVMDGIRKPDWQQVEADMAWLDQDNRHLITYDDARYPPLLREISDPPMLLYVQGDASLLSQWQLAIVGSRSPSPSGRNTAYDFARYLATGGLTIASGLAAGIDGAAHKGALAAGGKTLAVVATGLDRVYPAQHRDLAHQIVEQGAMVSELPLGTSPRPELFPRRNRIISGLSLGTLIVEAALKSGSLITARMAMEQAREVFAIPGSIHNPLSRGCHQLIREGAKLVETADDILEELGALAGVNIPEAEIEEAGSSSHEKDGDYRILFEHLGFDPIPIDKLIENSGLTADAVSSMLLLLELEGEVASLPGGRYVRTGL